MTNGPVSQKPHVMMPNSKCSSFYWWNLRDALSGVTCRGMIWPTCVVKYQNGKWKVSGVCETESGRADRLTVRLSLSLSLFLLSRLIRSPGATAALMKVQWRLWAWPSCSAPCPPAQCAGEENRAFTELSQHCWFCFHGLGWGTGSADTNILQSKLN